MNIKPFKTIAALVLCSIIAFSCSDSVETESETTGNISNDEVSETVDDATDDNGTDHEVPEDYVWDTGNVIKVELNGNSISVTPTTGIVDGSVFTITSAGTYEISGTLEDGNIVVDTDDEETVRLILNGAEITSTTTAPLSISNSSKAIIILADNTISSLHDGSAYVFPSVDVDEPNAALFSKTNLTIYGNGELMIEAMFNDGIASKDGLIIRDATVTVTSVDDAIRGKDYIIIRNGNLLLSAKGDGLKSDNEDDASLGFISIEAGTLNIIATGDAVNAQSDLLILDGVFNLVTGGGNTKSTGDVSSKGLKAAVNLIIENGEFNINSADDAIHSNNSIVINGGSFEITSSDDGIHADQTITVKGGDITIAQSYEGVESAVITVDGGSIRITSDDDGLNVAGGADQSGDPFSSSGNHYFYMNGGYVHVNSMGDGVDVNGSVAMTDGVILVSGPTANNNAALDYDGSFKITGGFVLAAGSSGMAQIPSASSSQNSVMFILSSTQSANTLVHLENESGETLFTFKPAKQFQSVAFSSPLVKMGSTYKFYSGGSATGTSTDGLISDGEYTPGNLVKSFTVSAVTTQIGSR